MPLVFLVLLAERLIAPAGQPNGDVQASGCHGHLIVAWRDGTAVSAAVDGKTAIVSTSTRGTPAVACGRDSWLVAWPSEDFGIDGRRVTLGGTLLAPLTLFRGPFGASEVAAAYGDGTFLLAWADGVTVRALRVDDSGAAIDAMPIRLAPDGFFVAPRVVWTGSAFFTGWAERPSNPFLPAPVRLWGTRVASGKADPVSQPILGSGTGASAESMTAFGERITFAWVAQHGAQTCVDIADVNGAVRQIRCSGDGAGDGIPVIDQAQILWSRGELVLVWRELAPDFSSVLRATRVDADKPPFEMISNRGWGPGLGQTSDGVAVVYFAADTTAGVFMRVVAQNTIPARRRAVGH